MDEATSHLDLSREQQVNEAISGMHLTRVIVAHRPETIASAERVLQLVDGRVVALKDHPAAAPLAWPPLTVRGPAVSLGAARPMADWRAA
jgi:energy-coupling factor transporter ATP-binding protein EcfA2